MSQKAEYHRFNPTATEFLYPNVFPATAYPVRVTPLWRNTDYPAVTFEFLQEMSGFVSERELPNSQGFQVGLRPYHWRSFLMEQTAKEGLPRYIDQKGGGFVGVEYRNNTYKIVPKNIEPDNKRGHISGIFEKERGGSDIAYTDVAQKLGVRTVPILGMSQLEEIIYQGRIMSVAEAKERAVLPHELEPVVLYRGYEVPHRLVDLCMYDEQPFPIPHRPLSRVMETYIHLFYDLDRQQYIREAVGQELIPREISGMIDESQANGESLYQSIAAALEKVGWNTLSAHLPVRPYLKWLLHTTWKNYALMHFAEQPFVHGYATMHNNTADGKVLDMDGRKAITGLYDPLPTQEFDLLEKSISAFLMTISELFGISEAELETINTNAKLDGYFLHNMS